MSNYFRNTENPENSSIEPERPKNTLVSEERKKKRKRRMVRNAVAIIGGLAVLVILVVAGMNQKAENCWKLEVKIEPSNGQYFVSEAQIVKLVQPQGDELVGKPIKSIPIDKIHHLIAENPCVKEAQVFTTVDGRCVIKISQRSPIARFFNSDGSSFFIDKDGFVFPSNGANPLKLPLFVGNLDEKMMKTSINEKIKEKDWTKKTMLDEMYSLSKFILQDPFLTAQVEHIFIDAKRNLVLVPRVGDHEIYIGDVSHLPMKFKKLKTFYASVGATHDLNKFKSIHLEYEGQVVCERKMY